MGVSAGRLARAEENPAIKGWDVESVLNAYKANWPIFLKNLEGALPIEISPESDSTQRSNLIFHNMLMTYGYVLAYCSRHKSRFSMLDWGGGIGHYYLISQKLLPELNIEYHCKDFPRFAEYGKTLFPEARFYSDATCPDFVKMQISVLDIVSANIQNFAQ